MKTKRIFLLLIVFNLILIATGCNGTKEANEKDIEVGVQDELFELKLYADKASYTADEIIFSYATVEYLGGEEIFTIYSSDPLVSFSLKDDTYFDGGYSVNDELISTTFYKNNPLRFDYNKSGGWSGDDPRAEFYKEFYSDRNLVLPPGNYELSVELHGSLDQEDIVGTPYKQRVSTVIRVEEKEQ